MFLRMMDSDGAQKEPTAHRAAVAAYAAARTLPRSAAAAATGGLRHNTSYLRTCHTSLAVTITRMRPPLAQPHPLLQAALDDTPRLSSTACRPSSAQQQHCTCIPHNHHEFARSRETQQEETGQEGRGWAQQRTAPAPRIHRRAFGASRVFACLQNQRGAF